MNELNLSISTGKDNNKVVLTAAFESHEDAVAFHSAVSELCNRSGRKAMATSSPGSWARQLITYRP